MAVWIQPVYDRTEEDVVFAQEQIQKWIDAKLSGNPVETYELKGCFNLTDINRIEGDIQYISDRLDELYYPPGTSCKAWEQSGLPTAQDVKRILSNVRLIIAAYHQQEGVPDVPEDMSTFSDINAIEENLYAIKQLLDSMVDRFQKERNVQVRGDEDATYQGGESRMAYVSREIKDRVAIGDNCFYMEELEDGRIMLTPAPDSVTETGTDINKALLQPIEDRVVWLMNRVFDDITSNPFMMSFGDLTGIAVTGVWNKSLSRIEC